MDIIMQGDTKEFAFYIDGESGHMTPSDISEVEFTLGDITKKYTASQISYASGVWYVPFTQAETASLFPEWQEVQIRVKDTNGRVSGLELPKVKVIQALRGDTL